MNSRSIAVAVVAFVLGCGVGWFARPSDEQLRKQVGDLQEENRLLIQRNATQQRELSESEAVLRATELPPNK